MSETCVLWYARYGTIGYEVCESVAEAAATAAVWEDCGDAYTRGVELEDRLIHSEEWDELKEKQRERMEADRKAAIAAAPPPPPTRPVRDPFKGELVQVLESDPAWIGTHGATE